MYLRLPDRFSQAHTVDGIDDTVIYALCSKSDFCHPVLLSAHLVHNSVSMFRYILCCGSCCNDTSKPQAPFIMSKESSQVKVEDISCLVRSSGISIPEISVDQA